MMNFDYQPTRPLTFMELHQILALLARRAGGEITISREELDGDIPWGLTVSTQSDGTLILSIKEDKKV